MEYAAWAPSYARLRTELGFPFPREEAAARTLARLLPPGRAAAGVEAVGRRLRGQVVVVVGLAPGGGAPPLWRLTPEAPSVRLVAADGATARCLDAGLTPDVVVTDLDGPVPSEVTASARGAIVVVHAHGDNVAALERWVPEFTGPVFGSWAGPPTDDLLDVGGFTDGDRAVFLADHVGAARILLWGFDFARAEEDDPAAQARKLRKLAWARDLLAELAARTATPIERWWPDGRRTRYGTDGTGPATQ